MTGGDLVRLAFSSISDPRGGMQRVMSLGLDRAQAWQALLVVVIASTLLGQATTLFVPPEGALTGPFMNAPLLATFVQLSLLVLAVFAVYWIGRAMGGTGDFEGAILSIAWLQFILVLLQCAQILALAVLPPLAGWLGILGLGLFFWLITNFTAALHGFTQLGKVFLMVLVSLVGIAFGLSLILSLIGIAAPGA